MPPKKARAAPAEPLMHGIYCYRYYRKNLEACRGKTRERMARLRATDAFVAPEVLAARLEARRAAAQKYREKNKQKLALKAREARAAAAEQRREAKPKKSVSVLARAPNTFIIILAFVGTAWNKVHSRVVSESSLILNHIDSLTVSVVENMDESHRGSLSGLSRGVSMGNGHQDQTSAEAYDAQQREFLARYGNRRLRRSGRVHDLQRGERYRDMDFLLFTAHSPATIWGRLARLPDQEKRRRFRAELQHMRRYAEYFK
ncbi:hypothetical protein C8R43DRAFT_941240 [Mycena crocata]|nr:hypothetical protein C8R43DRAFT_941240 [Mycena crocata]